ncbi:MAG: hypothetical protein FWB78_12665 [Treponema sp.]|nr:hypothetical protein [Treponema sp.]
MRKFVFFVVFLPLLFLGCGEPWASRDIPIVNESAHDVSFETQRGTRATVLAGQSITIRCDMGAQPRLYKSNPPRRVEFVQNGRWAGRFVNLQSIQIAIYNTLSIPVTLSAGGYLGNDPMIIPADSNDTSGTIYTSGPVFTVSTESFPATADFQIVNGTMFVTIR